MTQPGAKTIFKNKGLDLQITWTGTNTFTVQRYNGFRDIDAFTVYKDGNPANKHTQEDASKIANQYFNEIAKGANRP